MIDWWELVGTLITPMVNPVEMMEQSGVCCVRADMSLLVIFIA